MSQGKFKLIADSGSTKTAWVLLDTKGVVVFRKEYSGINPVTQTKDEITANLRDIKDLMLSTLTASEKVEINFYGAGCAGKEACELIGKQLSDICLNAEINVNSDMLGASRALLQKKHGVACILGTGSNSCCYDGSAIVKQVPSLGFILGDEGSGAALGKRFINSLLKGFLPEKIKSDFFSHLEIDYFGLIQKVYREKSPNTFLASIVPFIKEYIMDEQVEKIIIDEFKEFKNRNLVFYDKNFLENLCFTGGIAVNFEKQLRLAIGENFSVIPNPIEGLIVFHSS